MKRTVIIVLVTIAVLLGLSSFYTVHVEGLYSQKGWPWPYSKTAEINKIEIGICEGVDASINSVLCQPPLPRPVYNWPNLLYDFGFWLAISSALGYVFHSSMSKPKKKP